MKKIGLYLIIVLIIWNVFTDNPRAMSQEEGITNAFIKSGAQLKAINMNGHVSIKNTFTDPDEAKDIAKKIAQRLKIKNYSIKDTSNDQNTEILLMSQQNSLKSIIKVNAREQKDLKETYVVIDLSCKERINLKDWSEKIKMSLSCYGKVKVFSCITGNFKQKMGQNQQKGIIQNIFKCLNGKRVDQYDDGKLMSMVGYSNTMKKFITYSGKKANFHVATRYNAYEGKTYLWLATPLISIAY